MQWISIATQFNTLLLLVYVWFLSSTLHLDAYFRAARIAFVVQIS